MSLLFIYILIIFSSGCIDYIKIDEENYNHKTENLPPIIDINHISPHPSRLVQSINVGDNCKGQAFKVPPIEDYNKNDKLYYIWFLDNELVWPLSVVEPENRASAVITLNINKQFLMSHFGNKIPKNFFNEPHILDFFVSDLLPTIPESRLVEASNNSNNHADYAYWIVIFNNDSC
jgi:hypothetical protein